MPRQRKKTDLRCVTKIALVIAAILILPPYVIAPLYRFIDPVSTLMLWRYATGARVERTIVPLNQIAPALKLAVIVAEDGSFCRNPGIDLGAIREALRHKDIAVARGASTIAQQTAKNLFLWEGRSFIRKALEIPLAIWLNLVLSKRRILEIYLNIAQWGPNGEFGAEAGAHWAFNKSARDLSTLQATELAAILPNPVARSARSPGALVRQLASLYERRSEAFSTLDECVRSP